MLVSAMDVQDYELAEWILLQGTSVKAAPCQRNFCRCHRVPSQKIPPMTRCCT